jgi:hypothetical protein
MPLKKLELNLEEVPKASQKLNDCSVTATTLDNYGSEYIDQVDFGRVLDLLLSHYSTLVNQLHDALADLDDVTGTFAILFDSSVDTIWKHDNKIGTSVKGAHLPDPDEPRPATGQDLYTPQPPASSKKLPEVSFGMVFNAVNSLLVRVTGWDLREKITDLITGNIAEAGEHAQAWAQVSSDSTVISSNLATGATLVAEAWKAPAADSAVSIIQTWSKYSNTLATDSTNIHTNLDKAVTNAVATAQTVVDLLRTVIDLLWAGLTNACIPGYGQWKLIKDAWEAFKTVKSAWKCIKVFRDLVKAIIDVITVAVDEISTAQLPRPSVPVDPS